ncbi:MAG TPA: phosphohistidine phosphatase SixA [Halomonas sp.]|nr:phosphohistidine phosphatase SixA [Halomonas sp.]
MMTLLEHLLIMRHGEAGPGRVDRERELTRRGQAEARLMGGWLAANINHSPRLRVVASPYRRAQQTAALVADALAGAGIDIGVETLDGITPDDAPEDVVDWLLEQPGGRPLLLISHMPLVGALTGLLVEGRADRGPGFVTAAVAELEAEVWAAGAARLARMMTPAELA